MSWYPKISPSNKYVVGGSGKLFLNGKDLDLPGYGPVWIGDDTFLYSYGEDEKSWTYRILKVGGKPTNTTVKSGRALVAEGSRYAYQAGEGVVYRSGATVQEVADAGQPALTSSGFAYVRSYHAPSRIVLDNKVVHEGQNITNFTAREETLAWDQKGGTYYLQGGKVTKLADLPVWNRGPIPIANKYVYTTTHTGFIIRSFENPTKGFVFNNGGQCYFPDVKLIGNRIWVVFTNEAGVFGQEWVDVGQLTQDLLKIGATPPPPVVVPPVVVEPPKEEEMSYKLEDEELATYKEVLAGLGEKFPEWRTSPDDDERRKLAEAICQTLRARLGPSWGWKSAHSNFASPSKDASAKVLEGTPAKAKRKMAIFDMVNGTTREMNLGGNGEVSEQYFIPVEPKDWLKEEGEEEDNPPTPPTKPEEPPTKPPVVVECKATECKFAPCDCKEEVAALRQLIEEFITRPAPKYVGKLLGYTIRLNPE